ncbi:PAS domain S-box protein [Mariniflexile soesokkakense]|uniref:histidine kinase n=1 Tax=Mariniflexile soesokkakense TaxID=1343160 RepID=A0ABV0AFZ3_9FLAO
MDGIAITQLLVLTLQCVIVGSLLLFLFKLRSIFGLSLIFTALGVFQFMQTFLVTAFYIEVIPGIMVSPGSMVLFTGSLFAILLIYIREDAHEARKVIYALLAANLVLAVLQIIFNWSVKGQHVINVYNLPEEVFITNSRVLIVGTIVLFMDAFLIIFIYEIISRYISSLFFKIFFSMSIIVSIDSLFFSLGAFAETDMFSQVLFSGLIAKISSTVIYSLLFWIYLYFIDEEKLKPNSNNNGFEDIFHTLTYRQKYEQVFLEKENKSIELKKSDIRFRTLFESMAIGVTYQNTFGKIIDANPAAQQILGLTLEQMQGKTSMDPDWKAIHEDGSNFSGETHPSMIAMKTGKEVNSVIMGVFNPNINDYRWIKINATPLFRNSEKKPYQVFTTFEDITNELRGKQELNELYTKYQNIIHTANIGIIELDKNAKYTFVNPAWEKLFGYSSNEVLGKSKELILPKDQPTNLLFNKLLNGEISNYQIERKYQAKNGKAVWVDSYIATNNDIHGNLNSIVGVMVDITNRKQSEEELRNSENKLSQLLNNLKSGIVVHAPNTSIMYYNQRAAEILNSRYDDLTGKQIFDYPWEFLREDGSILPIEEYPVKQIIEHKSAIKNMIIGMAHSGTTVWALLNGFPVLNEKGEIKEVIISFIEITESVLANAKIAESEEKYKNLVEYSHDLIWAIDANGVFTFFNKASKLIYGYEPEELIGKSFFNFIPKTQIEKEIATFEEFANNREKILNYESQFIHKDGHTIYTLSNVRILKDNSGTFIGATGISKDITERKHKEDDLKVSEERFRSIVEAAPDPIFIQTNNCFAYLNKLAIKLFGVKDEKDLLGKPVLNYFHPDFHKSAQERIKNLNINKKIMLGPFEQILIQENGNEVWVETKGQPIFYNGENGGLVFIRDITYRKKAEKELSESKSLLESINNNLPGAIIQYKRILNGEDALIYTSEGSKELWGISPKEAMEDCNIIWNQIDDEYVVEVKKAIEDSFENLSPWNFEYKNNLPNGTAKWIQAIGIPQKLDDNSVVWDSIMLDVTTRKKTELELSASQAKYKLLAENITDVISLHGTDATYEYISPSVKEVRGYEPEDLLGKSPNYFIHPDDISESKSQKHLEKLLKGLPVKIIYRFKHKEGHYRWVESNRQPIMNENNEVVKIVSSSRDITDRIEKEQEIISYQKSLQNLTTEMMLVEEKQRKEIAANIHDHLSQSLVISKMKLNDLNKEIQSNEKRKEIGIIIKHISEALENTRKITYELSPPVLYELGLIEAIHWLAEKIGDENKVKVQFTTDFNEIELTEPKLILIYRAIQEILTNAVKHSGTNQIDIIFTRYGQGLQIVIEDKGIGFIESQINISRKSNIGFGLFAVKERIQNLNGTFSIDSKPGFGTKVKLFVPLNPNKFL